MLFGSFDLIAPLCFNVTGAIPFGVYGFRGPGKLPDKNNGRVFLLPMNLGSVRCVIFIHSVTQQQLLILWACVFYIYYPEKAMKSISNVQFVLFNRQATMTSFDLTRGRRLARSVYIVLAFFFFILSDGKAASRALARRFHPVLGKNEQTD